MIYYQSLKTQKQILSGNIFFTNKISFAPEPAIYLVFGLFETIAFTISLATASTTFEFNTICSLVNP